MSMLERQTFLAHAYVALRPAPGKSRPDSITLENIRQCHASEDMVEKAAQTLEREGFKVTGRSPLGLSIAGPSELVAKVFGTPLVRTAYHPIEGPPARMQKLQAVTHFEPQAELVVPEPLKDLVESARMAPKIIFYGTADAPALPYHHLDVPEDVARLIDAHAAHDHGFTGTGVRLCVIDSGFHPHEWYAAHGFAITLLGTNTPDDDWYGHGTGITTNAMAVAPGAQFFGVKLMDISATAAFQLAQTASPNVITCSWGVSPYDPNLRAEILNAIAGGATVCFAVGNGGPVGWPGSMPEVVSVGGVYIDEHGAMQASSYASSGAVVPPGSPPGTPAQQFPHLSGLTGMAPMGIYIAIPTQDGSSCDATFYAGGAAFPNGDQTPSGADGWLAASGTSSACPQVAGVAALILQANPTFTPAQVRTALEQCCRDVTVGASASGQAAGPGTDPATGVGLVSGFIAVNPVDVWCKDSADDNGCVPDTYAWPWTSPDVWVRAADDHGPDVNYAPEHGQANYVTVRARNRGRLPAATVNVRLYWADPNLAITWPAAWQTAGLLVGGVPGNLRTVGPVPAGGEIETEAFEWWPPDPLTLSHPDTDYGHACLLVRLECAQDPIVHEGDLAGDNNIAMRNIHIVDVLPDTFYTYEIGVGAIKGLEGKAVLTIDRTGAPADVTVKLKPIAFRAPGSTKLPAKAAEAVRRIDNITAKVHTEPLKLVRGARQRIGVTIKASPKARAGDKYVVQVNQTVGGRLTGHVTLVARVVDKAPYVGDRGTKVVHKWGCAEIGKIGAAKKVVLRTMNTAKALRYRPCPDCKP